VQQGQNPLDLPTSIPRWFGLSVDIIHNNHTRNNHWAGLGILQFCQCLAIA
jgi:hypothetical protein